MLLSDKKLLSKNTALNLAGQVVSSLVALVTIPYVVHGLGQERFGVLSIFFMLLAYLNILDFGFSRATTKYVVDAIAKSDHRAIPALIWTTLVSQAAVGLVVGIVAGIATPRLAGTVLRMSTTAANETRSLLLLLSCSAPVLICTGGLRAVIQGSQRFDLLNAVKVPTSSLMVLLPALGVKVGCGLVGIGWMLVLLIGASGLVYFAVCVHIFPSVLQRPVPSKAVFKKLLPYAGWVTAANSLVPLIASVDRFLIGSLRSVSTLGLYSPIFEIVNRLQIVPGNLGLTIFPALVTAGASDLTSAENLCGRSMKYLSALMAPGVFLLALFSRDILQAWLGSLYATDELSLVLKILAIGVLLDALCQMPAHAFDAVGRPDVRATILLVVLAGYAAAAWWMIQNFGVVGAAAAWALRAGTQLVVFVAVSHRVLRFRILDTVDRRGLLCDVGRLAIAATPLFVRNTVATTGGAARPVLFAMSGVVVYGWLATIDLLPTQRRQDVISYLLRRGRRALGA